MADNDYLPPEIIPMQNNMMDDPFKMVNGGMMPPNTTIRSETPQLIDSLLSNDGVNDKLKEEFFWVFLRDNPLTFLDQDRKDAKLLAFDILKIDALNDTPWYDYDMTFERKWNILRNIYDTKLDRALGTTNNQQKNERTVEQSAFSESRQISQHEDPQSYQKESFIASLLKRKR